MSSRYLEVARKVISVRGRPLTAQEILHDAARYGLMPADLSGETMHKTLQARITEDISEHRDHSAFYRTGPGIYFLRELSDDPTLSPDVRREFSSPGRTRPPSQGRVLHYLPAMPSHGLESTSAAELVKLLKKSGRYSSMDQLPEGAIRIGTFSIIRQKDAYFTYSLGKHSPFSEDIGKFSIGLRRYIDEFDRDLFSADDFGIDMSAAREVLRNLSEKGTSTIRDERFLRSMLRPQRCIIDHSFGDAWFILEIEAKGDISPLSQPIRRLDITKPKWQPTTQIDLTELDRVSRGYLSTGSNR
ncbi:MAG: winged helix-turn-helix domain-containing protein [Tabrizicola sp.]|uniref:winged helix-turn-helix domain-containing protein n=1 Tax=Tabrizicola sp. TaxID=2005166 RepID=UPI002ABCE242|nr:winged helix-turn-helix domain-containing protein [Tabrizicola sp.]MDZ4086946.1 winged helix-turn-helix domain-containing protein [Tabrizicola sp.]